MRYRDDKGQDYKVTQYMGRDPEKQGLYHVARIDLDYCAHTAGSAKTNPWTTEDIASDNLRIPAKKNGWKKVG